MKLSLTPEVLSSPPNVEPTLIGKNDSVLPTGLPLCGSLPTLQQLRLQIQIVSRHLRTAVLEIEPGLGDRAIAAEMAQASVHDGCPLLTLEAIALNVAVADRGLAGARHLLGDGNAGVIYLAELSLLSAAAQRVLVQLLSTSGVGQRWIFSTRTSLRTLRVRGLLLPELLRCLTTITLRVPPLRERLDDLPELAALLLATIAEERDVPIPALSSSAVAALRSHSWKNNLAELSQVLRASTLDHSDPVLDASHIRKHLTADSLEGGADEAFEPSPTHLSAASRPRSANVSSDAGQAPAGPSCSMRLEDVVDQHLLYVMDRCGGNKLRAAEMLHISRSTLYRMLDAIANRQPSLHS